MRERVQCQTQVNGHMTWALARDKNQRPVIRNGKVVRYPVIVGDNMRRCENEATASRMRNGTTEHKCLTHLNIWYVDEDGKKRNYSNEVVS